MSRIKLTINERILIHLIRYSGFEDEIEVPVDISQVGIADAIGIRWNNVPRAMRELKEKNMVVEKLLHIKGMKRRRKAYFLTDSGKNEGYKLRNYLQDQKITMRFPDGREADIKTKDAGNYLDKKKDMAEYT